MDKYYVYQLRRSDCPFPFYIGKGVGARINGHFSPSCLAKPSLKNNFIKKAVRDGVEVLREKLFENMTENGALLMEVGLISLYGRKDSCTGFLSNMSNGGDGTSGRIVPKGRKLEEDVKLKISKSMKGKPKTVLAGKNISAAKRGCVGRKWTQEEKDKVSSSMTGSKKSPETISKMRLAASVREAKKRLPSEIISQ